MLESKFKKDFLRELEDIFPGCIILHNDATLKPGIPDTVIFWNENWAMLEFKKSVLASVRPNQEYYVGLLDAMSFAAFVYPENRNEVLDALQASFRAGRQARISQSK
jgi:hypothetical protein